MSGLPIPSRPELQLALANCVAERRQAIDERDKARDDLAKWDKTATAEHGKLQARITALIAEKNDLLIGKGVAAEVERLVAERQQAIDEKERAERRAALYETTLRNIANEHWNAGRGVPISLMEYAQATLNVAADSDAVKS